MAEELIHGGHCRPCLVLTFMFLFMVISAIFMVTQYDVFHEGPNRINGEFRKDELKKKRSVGSGREHSKLFCEHIYPCITVCHDWYESYRNVDQECLKWQPQQNISDCQPLINSTSLPLLIGNGGGDSTFACENTMAATEKGLAAGMDGVRLDLSMSADGVVFLWRDGLPNGFVARLRQRGLLLVEKCKPTFLPRTKRPAHTLSWGQIKTSWFYSDVASGLPLEDDIPTLEAWATNYGRDERIVKIWLDVHGVPNFFIDEVLMRSWVIFKELGIQGKLFFHMSPIGEVIFRKHVTAVTQIRLAERVDELSDGQFEQMSELLLQPPKIEGTLEDLVYFYMLQKVVLKGSTLEETGERLLETLFQGQGTDNFTTVVVGDGDDLMSKVDTLRSLVMPDKCPNVLFVFTNSGDVDLCEGSIDALSVSHPEQFLGTCDRVQTTVRGAVPLIEEEPLLNVVVNTIRKCDFPCPRILWPVCGSDGNNYPNECVLRREACLNGGKVTQVHEGNCNDDQETKEIEATNEVEDCDSIVCNHQQSSHLTMEDMVCGSDGRIYENFCVFRKEQCKLASFGMRLEILEGHCTKNLCHLVCVDAENIVCGTDGISYRNVCTLRKINCANQSVRVFHYGICGNGCQFECPEDDFRMVCGNDGITYRNECNLYRTACTLDKPIYVQYFGKC